MTAMPNKEPFANQRRDLIQQFRDEHAQLMEDVRVSLEHTRTEGWKRLYTGHQNTEREQRRELAKRLARHATILEDFGWSEDDEKAVKDIAKASAEQRSSADAFNAQTVSPVKAPVLAVEKCCERFMNLARRDEQDAPLQNVGLVELMKAEIAKQPRVSWNDETGAVEITGGETQ